MVVAEVMDGDTEEEEVQYCGFEEWEEDELEEDEYEDDDDPLCSWRRRQSREPSKPAGRRNRTCRLQTRLACHTAGGWGPRMEVVVR